MRCLAVQLAMCLIRLELLTAEVLGHRHDRRRLILKLTSQTLLLLQYPSLPFVVLHSSFRERVHSFSFSKVEEGWLVGNVSTMDLP